eukprot:235650-Rhodomonas_salina.1
MSPPSLPADWSTGRRSRMALSSSTSTFISAPVGSFTCTHAAPGGCVPRDARTRRVIVMHAPSSSRGTCLHADAKRCKEMHTDAHRCTQVDHGMQSEEGQAEARSEEESKAKRKIAAREQAQGRAAEMMKR